MFELKRAWCGLLCVLACVAIAGCGSGEKLTTVTGKVVRDGQPIAIQDYEEGENCLSVTFIPLDADGKRKAGASTFSQDVAEDGSFEIRGLMGDGIPVGKYRVSVSMAGQEDEEEDEAAGGATDEYSSFGPDNSPFVFDITGGDELMIDLATAGE
jgi:hypothetical protein